MVLFKISLLLLIVHGGCALTSEFNISGFQTAPDAPTAKGDLCKDCTQIFELVADLFSNADLQNKVIDGIENLCQLLPGTPAKLCKEEVEKILPIAINLLTAVVKPADVCKIIGLCSSCDRQEKMLRYFLKEAFQVAGTSENEKSTKQCSFCIFLLKTLEDLLPKDRTETAVIDVLEEICHILPSSYREQCQVVISRFSKVVLDAILSYATPQAVCSLIHLCKEQEGFPVDPCTLATYRCRDIKSAIKCGTLFYCQKFAWKPLNDNML